MTCSRRSDRLTSLPTPGTGVTTDTIASLIDTAESGDRPAAEALFAALYDELHKMARRMLRRHGSGPSLGVTTLLHESYLDISGRAGASFPDRARFLKYASRVMRGLIIDHARSRQAIKRGGAFQITALATDVADSAVDSGELARLNDALDALAKVDPPLVEVVDLKFFCGFSYADIAAMRGVSERTVQRQWEKARIFLHQNLGGPSTL